MATETLPLFPLSQPVFPEGVLRLTIFEVRYLHLIRRCQEEGIAFGVVPLADGHEVQKAGAQERLHDIGCLVQLLSVQALQPAVLSVACVGTTRFRLGAHTRGAYGLWSGEIIPCPAPARLPISRCVHRIASMNAAGSPTDGQSCCRCHLLKRQCCWPKMTKCSGYSRSRAGCPHRRLNTAAEGLKSLRAG